VFLYAGYEYDPEDPWKGLLKSEILIFVSSLLASKFSLNKIPLGRGSNMFLLLQAQ
jgi:hypothetical protein